MLADPRSPVLRTLLRLGVVDRGAFAATLLPGSTVSATHYGLAGLVDGEGYFDLLADDVVGEYVVSVPGYPKLVEGRQAVIDLYVGYDAFMAVNAVDNQRVYRDPTQSVVVLKYEVHGRTVRGGRAYDNRFVSIVTVADGKVTHWRDYLDPVAIFDTTGWSGPGS